MKILVSEPLGPLRLYCKDEEVITDIYLEATLELLLVLLCTMCLPNH